MMYPRHDIFDVKGDVARGQNGAVDQDDRQSQPASGNELCPCSFSACILCNDMADAMSGEQRLIFLDREGSARDDRFSLGQRQSVRLVHQPQEIMVLRCRREDRQVLLADSEKDARRLKGQSSDRRRKIGHLQPGISSLRLPGCSLKSQQGNTRHAAGSNGVAAHLCGEGVRGIDDLADAVIAQVPGQPINTSETANPCRQRLFHGPRGTPCIGEDRVHFGVSQSVGKAAGFGRAAQKKDPCHV